MQAVNRPWANLGRTNTPAKPIKRKYAYRTRDGRLANVVQYYSGWWKVKIRGDKTIYTHFDTGNFMGSNSPDPLDIRVIRHDGTSAFDE